MDFRHFVALFLLFAAVKEINAEEVTISTALGQMKGLIQPVAGTTNKVFTFLGIPYAKPPVGDLRFAKPLPYGSWNGTLDATRLKNICMQDLLPFAPHAQVSEDCLFLNIYVPNNLSSMANRSVMVYIHGGGFSLGSGNEEDGSYLAAHGDVIVVTINYRLGIFGFFALGSKDARGNYGLWDQILALRWVNSNIRSFGGNPLSVTLFGGSAGAMSSTMLSMIPSSRGLFQKVIAQSGVANSFGATTNTAVENTWGIGSGLSCTSADRNIASFVKCMREKDVALLQNAYRNFTSQTNTSISLKMWFAPVVDSDLFMDTPENILSGPPSAALDFFRSIDLLTGNCDTEGSVVLLMYISSTQSLLNFNLSSGIPTRVLSTNILPRLVQDFFSDSKQVEKAICNRYCVYNDTEEQGRQVASLYGDLFFIAASFFNLNFHAQNNTQASTYQYVFSSKHRGPFMKQPPWLRGTGHGTDKDFIFLNPNTSSGFSPSDVQLAMSMQTYWTQFAKYGNPNGGSNIAAWPTFDPVNQYYLKLDDVIRAEMKYDSDTVAFWLKKIPSILRQETGSAVVDLSRLFSTIIGR